MHSHKLDFFTNLWPPTFLIATAVLKVIVERLLQSTVEALQVLDLIVFKNSIKEIIIIEECLSQNEKTSKA